MGRWLLRCHVSVRACNIHHAFWVFAQVFVEEPAGHWLSLLDNFAQLATTGGYKVEGLSRVIYLPH